MTDVCLVPRPSCQPTPCACSDTWDAQRPGARPQALTQALFDAFHNACCTVAPSGRQPWRAAQEPPRPKPPKG
jgi:hypothetical protein